MGKRGVRQATGGIGSPRSHVCCVADCAGLPKFYRWLSERYPLINQPGGATVVPIIDNLYLDMNGIIHNCTHANAAEVKLTEDEMIVAIFNYLDKLFHIVKPQKLIFMAIDGAPCITSCLHCSRLLGTLTPRPCPPFQVWRRVPK
jgi:hypothetical protein